MSILIFLQRRKNTQIEKTLKEFQERGIVFDQRSRASNIAPIEIVKKFMESAGRNIEDFPDILNLIGISLPVRFHNYALCIDRVGFETEDGYGDLHFTFEYKNAKENYEEKPIITINKYYSGLIDFYTYELNQ